MERQSLKYSVNKLVTYILFYCAGPGCLIYYCKLSCFLSRVSYLSLSRFTRVAVVFLAESYKTVTEKRSYVSFINIIKLLNLPVWSFWHCKSKETVSVTRKFVDCFACCSSTQDNYLAYGWSAGNLNWPIRIQQAGKILVSWCKVDKGRKGIEFRHLFSVEMALNSTKRDFQFQKPWY